MTKARLARWTAQSAAAQPHPGASSAHRLRLAVVTGKVQLRSRLRSKDVGIRPEACMSRGVGPNQRRIPRLVIRDRHLRTRCAAMSHQNRGVTVRAPSEVEKRGSVDIEELAHNIARMVEQGGRALAAYLKPREEGRV